MPWRPHFVYLGEAREEKGIHLIYEALRRRLPELEGIRFTIQCGRPELLGGLLEEWRRELPDVDFIDRNLTEDEYLSLLASADAVLVPYRPDIYDVRTSHVFLEAVGAGKPVMITAGTWMDLELARLGHTGVKAAVFSCAGVSDGLMALASQWRTLAGHAPDAAERCRAFHNPEEFFRRLLGLFKEPAKAPSSS
jgi:glycosyltransferase involved in cell wall biosynthesis